MCNIVKIVDNEMFFFFFCLDRDVLVLKTITDGEQTLLLEAWPEDLSPAQKARQEKMDLELKNMNSRIDHIVQQTGAHVIYQGDYCKAIQIGEQHPSLTFTGECCIVCILYLNHFKIPKTFLNYFNYLYFHVVVVVKLKYLLNKSTHSVSLIVSYSARGIDNISKSQIKV